jgi:hypothetical protein
VALLINAAYELLGFLLGTWVDVAQQTIERERTRSHEVGRVFDGLWWHTIHLKSILAWLADSGGGGPRRPPPNAEMPKEGTAAEARLSVSTSRTVRACCA